MKNEEKVVDQEINWEEVVELEKEVSACVCL